MANTEDEELAPPAPDGVWARFAALSFAVCPGLPISCDSEAMRGAPVSRAVDIGVSSSAGLKHACSILMT